MLHAVPQLPGTHLYCGPTSICAVTGLCQLQVLDAVQHYRGDREPVRAMCDHELVGVLGHLGYAVRSFEPVFGYSRLGRYVLTMRPGDYVEVLCTPTHFTAVSYTDMVDTLTMGEVVPLFRAPRMHCLVETILVVRRLPPRPQRAR